MKAFFQQRDGWFPWRASAQRASRITVRCPFNLAVVLPLLGLLALAGYRHDRLPPPDRCTSRQLVRWLIRDDLPARPHSFHVQLARRFEQLLVSYPQAFDLQGTDPKYVVSITNNTRILITAWLLDRAREPAGTQDANVDPSRPPISATWHRVTELFGQQQAHEQRDQTVANPLVPAIRDAWEAATATERRRLRELAAEVAMDWLRSAATHHEQFTDDQQRTAYLDQQLDRLAVAYQMVALDDRSSPASPMSELQSSIGPSLLAAEEMDAQTRAFLTCLQRRWFARSLSWLKPLKRVTETFR